MLVMLCHWRDMFFGRGVAILVPCALSLLCCSERRDLSISTSAVNVDEVAECDAREVQSTLTDFLKQGTASSDDREVHPSSAADKPDDLKLRIAAVAGHLESGNSDMGEECGATMTGGGVEYRDFRKCNVWSDVFDLKERPVCGEQVFQELAKEVKAEAKSSGPGSGKCPAAAETTDLALNNFVRKSLNRTKNKTVDGTGNAGASGASILFYNDFIVKSMDEETNKQLNTIQEWEKFKSSVRFGPPLGIVCIAAKLRDDKWYLFQRRIAIPSGSKDYKDSLVEGMCLHDGKIAPQKLSFDLKGPGFQQYLRLNGSFDLKARWTQKSTFYKHDVLKDRAFKKWFPDSLTIENCGAKEINQAFVEAADLLEKYSFNDYSFFGTVYERIKDIGQPDTQECECRKNTAQNTAKATWPLIIHTKVFGRPVVIAVGIIDYFETEYRTNWVKKKFSTMVGPEKFAQEFSRMWPAYFEVLPDKPDAKCDTFQNVKFVKAIASYNTKKPNASFEIKPREAGQVLGESPDGVKVKWCSKTCSSTWSSFGLSSQTSAQTCESTVPKSMIVPYPEEAPAPCR